MIHEVQTAAEYSRDLGLPESPENPVYALWLAEIEDAKAAGREEDAEDLLRFYAEKDFFFYCWQVSAMRDHRIDEAGHPHFGELWICEPALFYLCREYQFNVENQIQDPFYNLARYMYKSTIITCHGTVWETLREPTLTTAILTWKVEDMLAKLFAPIKSELEENPVILQHWPDVVYLPGEQRGLWTAKMLNVKRPSGIGEPSISIHGMDSLPSGFHVKRLKGDDCITQAAIKTQRAKTESYTTLRRATALGMAGTVSMWVGTIWDPGDANMRLLAEGFFTKRVIVPAFTMNPPEYQVDSELAERGTPNLHTRDFWLDWVRRLGPTETACQLQQLPRAHGERQFETHWLHEAAYHDKPEHVRRGLNVYMILDQAGEDDDSDDFVIRVVGLGADHRYRALDLWRERGLKIEHLFMLLFGPEEEDEVPLWMRPQGQGFEGLLQKWQPRKVYVEEYSTGVFGALRAEMNRRQHQFHLSKLPTIKKRSKEGRIKQLRLPYQRHEFLYPAQGFGHGSRTNKLDTYTQYLNEEIAVWVDDPDANECDGGLDSEAWLVQPETKHLFVFPKKRPTPAETAESIRGMTLQELHRARQGQDDARPPSPWAA